MLRVSGFGFQAVKVPSDMNFQDNAIKPLRGFLNEAFFLHVCSCEDQVLEVGWLAIA